MTVLEPLRAARAFSTYHQRSSLVPTANGQATEHPRKRCEESELNLTKPPDRQKKRASHLGCSQWKPGYPAECGIWFGCSELKVFYFPWLEIQRPFLTTGHVSHFVLLSLTASWLWVKKGGNPKMACPGKRKHGLNKPAVHITRQAPRRRSGCPSLRTAGLRGG